MQANYSVAYEETQTEYSIFVILCVFCFQRQFFILLYTGMAAILFDGAEPFEQSGNILLTEGPR